MSNCLQYNYLISLIVVPQSPRHPCLAEETEGDLCSVFWLVAPGGRSPHHHHCAAASCFDISIFKKTLITCLSLMHVHVQLLTV